MKTAQSHFKASSDFTKTIGPVKNIEPNFVLMFGSSEGFAKGGLAKQVSDAFPKALVIGCSSAGEISNDGVDDGSLVVTGCSFDRPDFRPVSVEFASMEETKEAGRKLASKLDKKGLKGIFVLGKGLNINGSALIEGIKETVGPDVVITGGLAGDGGRFKETFTILNGDISSNRVVGFGVYGENVQIAYGSMGGWEPFGPVRRVNKSSKNVMYEIDGEPALDIYKKYLGEKAKGLPGSGLLFPFALLKDDLDTSGLIRTILAVDEKEKSLTFAGDIPQGSLVRLMHANNSGLVAGARSAAHDVASQLKGSSTPNQGMGVLISCVGRKLVMGTDIEDEVDAVREEFKGVISGFYSYGEICPKAGFTDCKLHNQTMTITYFYEGKKAA